MIIRMMTTSRPQRRYDHRLPDLVQRTGDLTIATNRGVQRSTARGWLRAAPTVVVSLDWADLPEPELRQEILKLRRRVEKLAALLRLALALVHTSASGSPASACLTDQPSGGSCARWIERANVSRCEQSFDLGVCRPVGFRHGAAGRPRLPSTTSHRVLAPHRID